MTHSEIIALAFILVWFLAGTLGIVGLAFHLLCIVAAVGAIFLFLRLLTRLFNKNKV